jgi:hypothetical protein
MIQLVWQAQTAGVGMAWAKKTIENTAKVAAGRFVSSNRKDSPCAGI